MIQRMFYVTLRAYVKLAMRIFYKRWQIVNYNKAEEKGSIIFSSNHQNAFMDPLVILQSQPKIPIFLTQAAVFKTSALARWFFNLLYMLPIYRQRDKVNTLLENESTFLKCQDYLLEGRHPIGIYTEGSHSFKRTIRPLKKGICRLAFETMERNPELDLKIVPIGINYNDHIAFQTEVLIIFGEGINIKPYYDQYLNDKALACRMLLDVLRVKMGEIIINIPDDEKYNKTHQKWLKFRKLSNDLHKDFKVNQALINRIKNEESDDRELIILEEAKKEKKVKIILRTLLFPIWVYGFINNILPTWIIRKFMQKFVKNPHFHSSLKFVLGAFLVPIIYLMQALVVYIFVQSFEFSLLYFFTLPIFSWIYFRWLR